MKRFHFLFLLLMVATTAVAQRMHTPFGRGVVAVSNGSGSVTVTWRKLAQEPQGCKYNLYKRAKGTESYTKLAGPIAQTSRQFSSSQIPNNTELAVALVLPDGTEQEKSVPFLYKTHTWRNTFFQFDFDYTVLTDAKYVTKYAFPADIDGNGEMDAILVDRLVTAYTDESKPAYHKIQMYRLDGTLLWTVDMGPNVDIDAGQNDMIAVGDINCDGRDEVLVRSSDGTRFWDQANNTWGLYANHSATGDTDSDGIINYCPSQKNPPFYISVIDGLTGAEIDCAELNYSEVTDGADHYGRNNRSDYKGDNNGLEYAFMVGHFAIAYEDGIHPSLMMECLDRTNDNRHHNYMFSFGYDWSTGRPVNFHHEWTWSRNDKSPWPAEFHGVRVCDVDGDGIDELMNGGASVNTKVGMVASAGIGHGDRFRVSDIDPDRPGLEEYAIQQSALLGQLLFDPATGEHLIEHYQSSVVDVGRGECMDVDPAHKGYEFYSTMGSLYDCKGKVITSGSVDYPFEGIWWDGDLQREVIGTPGGSGYGSNVIINKYGGSRLIQFSKDSGWMVHSSWGNRPAFVGDMTGDWREEIILMNQDGGGRSTGLVGYSTDLVSNYSIHTLQQDPHYAGDITTRGYYQSPNTTFYLGGDMPAPQLPPFMITDLRWRGGDWQNGFTSFDMTQPQPYADGKSLLFDISGDNASAIAIPTAIAPSQVYLMNPKGKDYTFTGGYGGTTEIIKSMQGRATINGDLSTTAPTIISEGTLEVNGTIAGPLQLLARGTLAGAVTLKGGITFEGGLNYEGGRLMPRGTMTFDGDVTFPGDVYVETGLTDKVAVGGNLTLKKSNTFTIAHGSAVPEPGEYVLLEATGGITRTKGDTLLVRGMDGIACGIKVVENKIVLTVKQQREPATDVAWTGAVNSMWDYDTENFALRDEATTFVTGDAITFGNEATNRKITLNHVVEVGGLHFDFDGANYSIAGNGGFTGTGGLTKDGMGTLVISNTGSTFTGPVVVNSGTLSIPTLGFAGKASALGSASADAENLQLGNATLRLTTGSAATDHAITIKGDTATIELQGTTSLTINGRVSGGVLVKTGAGQLNFGYEGVNNFNGIILRQGTIGQNSWRSTYGKTGSRLVFEGGTATLIANNSMGSIPELNYKMVVPEGKKGTIKASFRSYTGGSLEGSGTLTYQSGGDRSDWRVNARNFAGTLNAEGVFRYTETATDMPAATLTLLAGATANQMTTGSAKGLHDQVRKIGALASTATDCTLGEGTWEIGHNNQDATYAGKLATGVFRKVGTGKWTLTGSGSDVAMTLQGGTTVVTGGKKDTPFTTGAITVQEGATLIPTGYVQNVIVNKGGTLAANVNETTVATAHIQGSLNMKAGSTLEVRVRRSRRSSNDKYAVQGAVTLASDTIHISFSGDNELEVGESITVFSAFEKITGKYIIKSDAGVEWDDTDFLTTGKLTVKGIADGIHTIDNEQLTIDNDAIYDLSGRKMGEADVRNRLPRGIYLQNGHKFVVK